MRRSTVVAALVVSLAARAWAADSATAEAQADELMRHALELRRQGQNAQALELLQKAQALAPSARTLAQLGSAEFALQRWVDAEAHLQRALASHDSAWIATPRNREMLEKTVAETRKHVARIDMRGTPGAQISIDGKPIGTLPLSEPIHVAAGPVRIDATAAGWQAFEKTLTVRGAEETTIAIDLVSLAPPTPAIPAASPSLPLQPRSEAPAVPLWRRSTGGALMLAGLSAVGMGIAWVAIDGRTSCNAPPGGVCELVYDTKTRGWISIGAGVVAAGAGATLFFWKGKEATASVAVAPGVLTLHGRF